MMNMPNISSTVKQIFFVCLLLPLLSTSLSVHAVNPIKINTYTDYPPYLYQEQSRQTGLYIRIIDLTFKAIAQPYSVQTLPFKRGLQRTVAGDGIMIAVLKTAERQKTLDFSEPFYQERLSVYLRQAPMPKIKTLTKLKGLNIGTLLGWSYGAEFDQARANNYFFAHDSKLETNFYLLAKGRLDAVIHSELSAAYVIDKMGLNNKVVLASEPLAFGDIHLAVKKGTHKALLERINQKLREPAHINEIKRLIQSYH